MHSVYVEKYLVGMKLNFESMKNSQRRQRADRENGADHRNLLSEK